MTQFTDSNNMTGNGSVLATTLNQANKYTIFHIAKGKKQDWKKVILGHHSTALAVNASSLLLEGISGGKVHKVSQVLYESPTVEVPQMSNEDKYEMRLNYSLLPAEGLQKLTYGSVVIPWVDRNATVTLNSVEYVLGDQVAGEALVNTFIGTSATWVSTTFNKMRRY